jgi:FkbM family methyltransferase
VGEGLAAMRAAAEAALADGVDWLLFVSAAETLAPDIFAKTAPALRIHDAVWGGAARAEAGQAPKLERITRLAAQDLPNLFHAALHWWIGPSHFVKPAAAIRALRAADISGCYADYMIALWQAGGAYKTAQCLTHFRGPLPEIAPADRVRLLAHLEAEPVFATLYEGERQLKVPYTGLNPVIEREQLRGLFFEEEELRFLAARLPRGMRIVDAGANTGNHTLFFAAPMQAEVVIPIEPEPRAVAAIRALVSENQIGNADLTCLGTAIGAMSGRMRAVPSATAGLGATHFVPDPDGNIPLTTLDELISGPVDFLKLDVEGMEMTALAGAAQLIAAQRPVLYVEVVDENIGDFMAWIDANGYIVEKLFPDKTHCNYLLLPMKKKGVQG